MSDAFSVLNLLDLELPEQNDLKLTCISGKYGLGRKITHAEINRPGLALNGFFEQFAAGRLQLFGKGEQAFLKTIVHQPGWINVQKILAAEIPCCIFTHGEQPLEEFQKDADDHNCPVLVTPLSSSEFSLRALRVLSDVFAPSRTLHGVMVEVYGLGVLLTGESGVGKSETALELIERGHCLVSDDSVKIKRVSGSLLIARAPNNVLGYYIEVRGLGIINVPSLFGISAIKEEKRVALIIELETFRPEAHYERLGTHEDLVDILGVKVPKIKIPIKPGRNIAVLVETAVINQRLKAAGYNAAQYFNYEVQEWLESERIRDLYFTKKQ